MKDLYRSLCIIILTLLSINTVNSQTGYTMQPVSGADGVFETVDIDGETVH